MGLLSTLITLPVSGPIKGSLWAARQVHHAAERELNDPGAIRRELARLERVFLAGEITEEAYDDAELELLQRLKDAKS